MDNFWMDHVKRDTPKMNPDITEGLAVKMMPKAIEHLDTVTRSVAKDFIPGLRFKGFGLWLRHSWRGIGGLLGLASAYLGLFEYPHAWRHPVNVAFDVGLLPVVADQLVCLGELHVEHSRGDGFVHFALFHFDGDKIGEFHRKGEGVGHLEAPYLLELHRSLLGG